jgi:hypothetical protein
MKNRYFLIITFLIVAVIGCRSAAAQITINIPSIPKIPKVKKTKVETTNTTTNDGDNQSGNSSATTENKTDEQPSENIDFRLLSFLDKLAKAQKEVDEYSPNDGLYLVGSDVSEWLSRAVSATDRAKFYEEWKTLMTPGAKKKFDDSFAQLAASAAKKLPGYKSNIPAYTVRNPAEEKLMKGTITRIADYKIFSSGLLDTAWLIEKNEYGLPKARYKRGVIYSRDAKSDHPYCYADYFNINQDYAGGGTYGASFARYMGFEMVGCPAVAK